jgi:hypothetical protein
MHLGNNDLLVVRDLATILLSFAGFLRFDEVSSLLCSDVKIECEYLFLFIRKSKTNQYRNGNEVLIAKGETVFRHLQPLSTESTTYPSLLLSLFQRPCLFHTLSLISELAVAVAPPDLIECRPSFNPLETNLNLETILSLAAV